MTGEAARAGEWVRTAGAFVWIFDEHVGALDQAMPALALVGGTRVRRF